jgi:hypothetical protein
MPDFTYMNNRIDNVFTLPLQGVDYGLPGVFYVMLHTNEVEAVSEAGTIIRGYDSNQLRIAINAFLTYNNA